MDAVLAALDALGALPGKTNRRPEASPQRAIPCRRNPKASAVRTSRSKVRSRPPAAATVPQCSAAEEFKLYANLRPARTLIPGGRFDNIDLVVVRENLEGLYIGHEIYIPIDDDPHALAMATGVNTRQGSRRLLDYAFAHAVATGRKKVAIVHKANIMKALTGIFLETGLELYERKYKGQFILETVIIDACAMKLVLNPWQFDVLVTTNLFGDILSDLVAGLVGGLGMTPGANICADAAIFEAVLAPRRISPARHRQSMLCCWPPDDAQHCHLRQRVARGDDQTLNLDKVRTGDLGGNTTPRNSHALVHASAVSPCPSFPSAAS